MMRRPFLFACLLAVALPAVAQQRTLEVPAGARWQHARSGVILPTVIDGLPRRGIAENVPDEIDLSAHYEDGDTRVSIFLFRPSLFDVGIWFDRAEAAAQANPTLGRLTPASAAPVPFARAGTTVASAMRRSYVASGEFRATALAIVPTGRWMVKIRVSSRSGDVARVDARVDAALAAMRFDAEAAPGPLARIVAECPTPIRWRSARQQRPTMDDAVMGAFMGAIAGAANQGDEGSAVTGQATAPAAFVPPVPDPALCRDASTEARFAVYRGPAEPASYVMAFGDAGTSASVGDALTLDALTGGRASTRKGVILSSGNETLTYSAFNRLPSPSQVFETIQRSNPMARSVNDPDLIPAAGTNNETVISVGGR